MQTQITDVERFTLTVAELNAAGAPVPFGGVPSWISSDDGVVTVTPSGDGVTAVVSSVAAGVATVTVAVDGLTTTDEVTVVVSPGVQLVLTASAPEPK